MSGPRRAPFVAGLLAAGAAVLVISAGRILLGPPGFLDVIADGVTLFVPLDVFEAVLDALGPLAKGLAFAGVAAGAILTGGIAGLLFARVAGTERTDGLFIAAVAWLLAQVIALPLAGAGLFATSLDAPLSLHLPLLIGAFAYGLLFTGIRRELATSRAAEIEGAEAEATGVTRRRFLGGTLSWLGVASLAGAFATVLYQVVVGARRPAGGRPGEEIGGFGPTPALTPVEDFYKVDKNLIPPELQAASWRLAVDGLVERPQSYTLDDLRAKPAQELYRTLECISYQVVPGDDLISNQRWAGVHMSELLDEAGVQPDARFVLFESADGYTESIPLEVARDALTWVAYEMGPPGTLLTPGHGFPARVLIAGRFGMKQPKWLTRIQLAAADVDGYWEQRGWDKQAVVVTMSRIDWPRPNAEVPVGTPFMAYGIANSGDREIARVEVSADDGATWTDAEVEPLGDPLGPLTWVRWRVSLTIPTAGTTRLAARATDGDGGVQDGTPRSPLPAGATGWHRVRVTASTTV